MNLTSAAAPPVRPRLGAGLQRLARAGVERGVHPSWFGYRWVQHRSVPEYVRTHAATGGATFEEIHAETIVRNPLPRNIRDRHLLPADRGWWGYSFYDVPERVAGQTFIATIRGARIVWYRDPARGNDFYPAILSAEGHALDLREIRFRRRHAELLRRTGRCARVGRATWILERVYHNHSHWLTAHLPKLLLLREQGALEDVLLPPERTPAMDGSLVMAGMPPERFPVFDAARPIEVDVLTVVGTDRFRPELLRMVAGMCPPAPGARPFRRVLISRAAATRRRLVNEDDIWPMLDRAGFERVCMEQLTFEQQVATMRETAVLIAPHGAGLTNMMFCPAGVHVVEIADLGFPNPNFYALAAAMGHHYWIVPATALGECHPLQKDLHVDPVLVNRLLPEVLG